MRLQIISLGLTLCLPLTFSPVHAQQTAVKQIAPFVDQSTFVVVRVHPDRLDAPAILEKFGKWASIDKSELAQATLIARTALAAFQEAGDGPFYIGMSMDDGWAEPFFIIPGARENALNLIQGLLRMTLRNATAVQHQRAIVIGTKRSVERIQAIKPDMPNAIADEFAKNDTSDVRAVLWIPPILRKSLAETAPALPGLAIGEASKPIFQGWRRLSLALDTKPKLKMNVIVHANDEQTAEGIERLLGAVLVQLRKNPQVKKEYGDFGKWIPILRPRIDGKKLVWWFDDQALAGLVTPLLGRQRDAANRQTTHNKLRHFGLAMHNYLDANKTFPPRANFDANGKPLLSWRVHLLPYLEQIKLYKQFKLNEPWNSAHNKKLIAKMPAIYQSVVQPTKAGEQGKTRFLAPVGEKAIFHGTKGISIRDIRDGTSNTILVVEADAKQAALWTKPDDLATEAKNLRDALFGAKGKSFMCVIADGSSHVIPSTVDNETLRALFTINGGEAVKLP